MLKLNILESMYRLFALIVFILVSTDVVTAQEILQNAFRTDLRALVAEARLRAGAALSPIDVYRKYNVRQELIKNRGAKTVATGL